MINPESQDKSLNENSSDSVAPQYSILGFIVNIVIVLFWLFVMGFCFYLLVIEGCKKELISWFRLLSVTAMILFAFHLYVLIDPEYGNDKEDAEMSVVDVLKNHWAILLGTALFYLTVSCVCYAFFYNGGCSDDLEIVSVFLAAVSVLYSVSGMICWGFVTKNRDIILALIVRPWQLYELTENKNVNV